MNIAEFTTNELLNELTKRMKNMSWVEKAEFCNKIGVTVVKEA